MMTTISRYLPMDLVEEKILCYVPPMDLNRFKSTCKRWNRLFNGDSRFARKHTDKAAKQFLVLMLKGHKICLTIFNALHRSVEFKSELSLVDSQSMYSAQFVIARVFHCDGLLLCSSQDNSRFVVWNPFNGETRWFQRSKREFDDYFLRYHGDYFLGYYEKDNSKIYKILILTFDSNSCCEIYDFSSDSWRVCPLDNIVAPGWRIAELDATVSLKGNTYWFAEDRIRAQRRNMSLLKFDFQTEKSVPVPLPYQCPRFKSYGLSTVREEKLSMLLQRDNTSKTEIWVTNKINETSTQVVSWSKVLTLDLSHDLQIYDAVNFLFDEEKKVAMMCVTLLDMEDETKNMMYTVGEDEEVTQVDLGTDCQCKTSILNYVPRLVQMEQAGLKRKRGLP